MLGLAFAILNVRRLRLCYSRRETQLYLWVVMDGIGGQFVSRSTKRWSCSGHMGLVIQLPSNSGTEQLTPFVNPGLITAGVCNLCLAASLAEFLSAYPT